MNADTMTGISDYIITMTDQNGDVTTIDIDLEFENEKTILDRRYFIISQTRGPWFSLGIHVDFQGRFIDLHIGWLIVTIGRPYHKRD